MQGSKQDVTKVVSLAKDCNMSISVSSLLKSVTHWIPISDWVTLSVMDSFVVCCF